MPRGHVLPDRDTIAALRGEAGMTQQNLAERAGYGVRTISKIESGQPTNSSTLAAIAIVLAESLRRPIHLVDLICQPRDASRGMHSPGGTMIVAENIKLLDLETQAHATSEKSPASAPSRAVLIDTFRLRYLPADLGEIDFYYATSGKALSARSLSHPEEAHWGAADRQHERMLSRCGLPETHVLRIGLKGAAKFRRLLVQNQVEYVGAFDQPGQQQFYVHIVYPTDCLTLLVRFPADRSYSALRGRCRRSPGGPAFAAAEQPIDLSAGRLAYWRVMAPTPGETYELGWS
ncbi:MAG TPA: helix-turn-helix transcriptional regulator [Pirellulales bacterium]|jgi:transcriptional regulator with XRE-family HTH domain|nr:helix-turn-helix transcriptional regulator [Pirellulales bacterium]